ncbi:MAG: oligosaccharide flippase family protein [Patescibacteria group bacterium]
MGYTKNAISGFGWQSVLKIISSVVTVAKIFFLARLLSPADFGLFSLTLIALGLTESLTQTGVNVTIIQSRQSIDYFLDTAWVVSIIRGLVIGILMTLLGFLMGRYYSEPQLVFLVAVASLVPIIKGFINPAIVSLYKDLKFFHDSLYRLSLVLVESVLAIIIAFFLHSVFALILAVIGSAIFEVAISFIFFKSRPRLAYTDSRGKEIINNAKWLSPAALLNYLNENADDFILGKIVGLHSLGIYHNAYALSHKVNYDVAKSIYHGTFPILTKIAHKTERINQAFKKSFLVTLIIGVLGSLPVILFPGLVVKILLGEQWLEATHLVVPLTIAGLIQSLSLCTYGYFIARKMYRIVNLHLVATLILMAIAIIILGKWQGLFGAVVGITLSRLITLPIVGWGVWKNVSNNQ